MSPYSSPSSNPFHKGPISKAQGNIIKPPNKQAHGNTKGTGNKTVCVTGTRYTPHHRLHSTPRKKVVISQRGEGAGGGGGVLATIVLGQSPQHLYMSGRSHRSVYSPVKLAFYKDDDNYYNSHQPYLCFLGGGGGGKRPLNHVQNHRRYDGWLRQKTELIPIGA